MNEGSLGKKRAPLKTQKNLEAGMFRADSLGDATAEIGSKPMDVEAAKANIRRRREIFSGEFQRKEEEDLKKKKEEARIKAWWKHRENWRSVRIENKVGKVNPKYDNPNATHVYVEFIDGTAKWVNL